MKYNMIEDAVERLSRNGAHVDVTRKHIELNKPLGLNLLGALSYLEKQAFGSQLNILTYACIKQVNLLDGVNKGAKSWQYEAMYRSMTCHSNTSGRAAVKSVHGYFTTYNASLASLSSRLSGMLRKGRRYTLELEALDESNSTEATD